MTNLEVLFSFQGRIRRLQWWLGTFIAAGIIIAIVVGLVLVIRATYGDVDTTPPELQFVLGSIFIVFYGVLFWVQLALGVKRLHDRDSSGWWMLLQIVPFGGLVLLVMLGFLDGTQGPNKYGPSPKGIGGSVGNRELGGVFS
ncbi:MAG: DUF805 domain-containing protein [Hyphomonadaceae bacterium]|nr:DUF805 domain-containing protein [Hyphomonadaceae bacterium]